MSLPAFVPASSYVPPYVVKRWYPTAAVVNGSGVAAATDLARFYPILLRQPITASDLGTRVTTVGGGSFQLALYANNPVTMRPTGTVLARTRDMLTTSLDVVSADITGANVTLAAGMYWGATNVDSSSAAAIFQTAAVSSAATTGLVGAETLAAASSATGITLATLTTPMTYNTWSDVTAATFTEVGGLTGAAHIFLKAA